MAPTPLQEPPGRDLDAAALRRLRDQLQGAFHGFLSLFLSESQVRAAAVRDAVDRRDAKLLGREAHSLRPTSDLLGAHAVADACRRLEAACADGWSDAAAPAAEDLLLRLDRLRPHLEPMLHDS